MDMFDEVFQYLRTVSPEMMVTHDGYLKRFILNKPKPASSDTSNITDSLNIILQKHNFKGKLAVKEQCGYIKIIYCVEYGLKDPDLIKYFEELEI